MRGIVRGALAALCGLALASCSKDEPTAPPVAQLAGSWTATRSEYVATGSAARFDLVAAGGSATLLLSADHRYAYVETRPGQPPDTTHGGWSTSGDEMRWTFDGNPDWVRDYTVALAGNTLHLSGGDVLYDFGAGGGLEEAQHSLVLTRP